MNLLSKSNAVFHGAELRCSGTNQTLADAQAKQAENHSRNRPGHSPVFADSEDMRGASGRASHVQVDICGREMHNHGSRSSGLRKCSGLFRVCTCR